MGSIAAGDIGRHFLIRMMSGKVQIAAVPRCLPSVKEQGYVIGNADITIMAQAPKMAPHIDSMCQAIAQDSETSISNVNVKATTTERLGFTGHKRGASACEAVVLIT